MPSKDTIFDFEKFCKEWGIEYVTCSPHMSNSNGVAVEAVKEMKKIIQAKVSPSGVLNRPVSDATHLRPRHQKLLANHQSQPHTRTQDCVPREAAKSSRRKKEGKGGGIT
jgi:hypothetical protein